MDNHLLLACTQKPGSCRPINKLMFFEEVVATSSRIALMVMIVYVVVMGNSFEAFVDSLTETLFGTRVPFCQVFFLFEVFSSCYAVLGSYNVAFFR